MAVTLIKPEGLPDIDLYHQVAVASGSRTVYISGQVSWDADGATIGEGDLAAQIEQCYRNVGKSLAAAGADFADVVKLTFYVVDWTPDKMPQVLDGLARGRAALGARTTPPLSLFGVVALDIPEHLVELEAVAVLD